MLFLDEFRRNVVQFTAGVVVGYDSEVDAMGHALNATIGIYDEQVSTQIEIS